MFNTLTRVSFFVDGFNLYCSLKDSAMDCRWLSLQKLCNHYINSETEAISEVFYFSALALHYQATRPEKVAKHKKYINKLKQERTEVILGKFKKKTNYCTNCKTKFNAHEEKQTDVNIALKILEEAVKDTYDTAILVSGDTDMIPAILTLKRLFPEKRIGVLFPIGRKTIELEKVADFSRKITKPILRDSLFGVDDAPEGWVPVVCCKEY